ncbi:hypothetical protein FQA47_000750 [Oryzias melastigma]|uniref:Uncharacterized protein n=1 Tax=Oryzias melastigma TaxID=30732 RepID=A0A834CTZ7_ORYME|nr:hypothetical protein FQA47_000750 [Oryzias melastigma]
MEVEGNEYIRMAGTKKQLRRAWKVARCFAPHLCHLCPLGPSRDDRSKSMFVSRQQASGRLSSDLGGKGEKGSASCCGKQ